MFFPLLKYAPSNAPAAKVHEVESVAAKPVVEELLTLTSIAVLVGGGGRFP
jgi:hypothetical protein